MRVFLQNLALMRQSKLGIIDMKVKTWNIRGELTEYNIKNCPCGAEADLIHGAEHMLNTVFGFWIECEKCENSTKIFFDHDSAIEEWNKKIK